MTVIINEFEVIVEAAAASTPAPGDSGASTPAATPAESPAGPTPMDLRDVLAAAAERARRVRAD